jgi:membrane protein required for colicin V production
LVFEVLSVFVWIAAFVLAQWYAPEVAGKLPMAGTGQSLRYAAGFVLVFVGTAFVAGLFVQLTALWVQFLVCFAVLSCC